MIKTETYDNASRGMIYTTTREWIAPNGHKVTITSRNNRKDGTRLGDLYAFSSSIYACECGKKHRTSKTARKAELDSHDSWLTDAEMEESTRRLLALLNA